jgi:hypothetical protein
MNGGDGGGAFTVEPEGASSVASLEAIAAAGDVPRDFR